MSAAATMAGNAKRKAAFGAELTGGLKIAIGIGLLLTGLPTGAPPAAPPGYDPNQLRVYTETAACPPLH